MVIAGTDRQSAGWLLIYKLDSSLIMKKIIKATYVMFHVALLFSVNVANANFSLQSAEPAGVSLDGEFLKTDEALINRYLRQANLGNVSAQYNLALIYAKRHKDYSLAAFWYTKAAKQGHRASQNNLAVIYEHGKGVLKNYEKAVYWYEQAARLGDPVAQSNLGVMYELGRGVDQDYNEAARWYGYAAAQGDTVAMKNLGDLYQHGTGVTNKLSKAIIL